MNSLVGSGSGASARNAAGRDPDPEAQLGLLEGRG